MWNAWRNEKCMRVRKHEGNTRYFRYLDINERIIITCKLKTLFVGYGLDSVVLR
jgi:hypothetical protein